MLIFKRKQGQSIQIDDDIKLTICGTQSNQARVGIEAHKGSFGDDRF